MTELVMKDLILRNRSVCWLASAVACLGLLSSCATGPTSTSNSFRFRVVCYDPPVQAARELPNDSRDIPEDAAVAVAMAMQRGDVNRWLACWEPSERPEVSQAERQTLPGSWHISHDSTISVLGRIVTGTEVIVELALLDDAAKPEKLQIPLKKVNDQWWLTSIDPQSEYLHWESSPNKIVDHLAPGALQSRLSGRATQDAKP